MRRINSVIFALLLFSASGLAQQNVAVVGTVGVTGTLTAVTSITNPVTVTGTVTTTLCTAGTCTETVVQPTAANLNATIVGTKTNNNAAPGATNLGTLSAVANAAQPSWTEGNIVAESVDLKGRTRTMLCDSAGNDRCTKVDSNNNLQVVSPGIVYNSTQPTKTNGQTDDFQITSRAALIVAPGVEGFLESAKGVSSEQTAVTTGQTQTLVSDLVGKLIVLPYANPENFVNGTVVTITDTTSTATLASAGGSLRNYVTHCTLSNSHATVSTQVQILDGSTVIDQVYLLAAGGGASLQYPVPLKGTAATAINIKPVTTGSNIVGMCNGYKGL